jgi:hypothetical protein
MAGQKSHRAHSIRARKRHCSAPSHRSQATPRIEVLEDRCLPTTFTPTTFADGGSGSGSLRDAVLQANADTGTASDMIQLKAGTYALTIVNTNGHETAGLQGDLNITSTKHSLIIQGTGTSGSSATIIDASMLQDRILEIVNPGTQVTLRNLVITGGLAQDDGAAGVLPGTTPAYGGDILNDGGNLKLDNVVIENGLALGGNGAHAASIHNGGVGLDARGGGIYSQAGTLTIAGSKIANNKAGGGAGGAGGQATPHSGPGGQGGAGGAAMGGGIYVADGILHVSTSVLTLNQAVGGRGGVGGAGSNQFPMGGTGGTGGKGGVGEGGALFGVRVQIGLSDSHVVKNQAIGGTGGTGGIGGSPAEFSSATGGVGGSGGAGGAAQGGGIFASEGMLTLTALTLSGNMIRGGNGGAGGSGGTASLGGNGGAGGHGGVAQGGGLFVSASKCDLSMSTADHNRALGGSGGIGGFGAGGFTTGASGAGGNGGAGGAAQGAGLFVLSGTLTLTNSTIPQNTAKGGSGGDGGTEGFRTGFGTGGSGGNGGSSQGGGLYLSSGSVDLANCTIALNATVDSVGGKAAINGKPGVGAMGQGGGVNNAGATVNALNTIIAQDKAAQAPDFFGDFATASHNLLGNNAGSNLSGGNGNLVGTPQKPIDPMLAALANNGGPTKTMALLDGSPAIDSGTTNGAPSVDQRGVTRGQPPDIGAFEDTSDGSGS